MPIRRGQREHELIDLCLHHLLAPGRHPAVDLRGTNGIAAGETIKMQESEVHDAFSSDRGRS